MDRTNEEIFNFAYELALRDATIRTAFRGTTIYVLLAKDNPDTKYKATDDDKNKAERAKTAVKDYIDKIFDTELNTKDEHDKSFTKAAKKVIDAFEGYRDNDSSFSFGNAQKLINMTAKYMFMATYDRPELRDNFKCCHCPMDSIMVEHVISKIGGKDGITFKEINDELDEINDGAIEKRPGQKGWKGYLRKSWSTLELTDKEGFPGQYVMFQKIISILAEKENCSPIAYDFFVWGEKNSASESQDGNASES